MINMKMKTKMKTKKVISIMVIGLFLGSGIVVGVSASASITNASITLQPKRTNMLIDPLSPELKARGYKTIYFTDFSSMDWTVYIEVDANNGGGWQLSSRRYYSSPYSARCCGGNYYPAGYKYVTGMYKYITIPQNWMDVKITFYASVYCYGEGNSGISYVLFYVNGDRNHPLWSAGVGTGQDNFDWKSFTYNLDTSVSKIEFYWYSNTCNNARKEGAYIDNVHVYGIPPPPNQLPIEPPNDVS